jgi:hypothetical protein
MNGDKLHMARTSIAASSQVGSARLKSIHLAVARTAVTDVRKELDEIEIILKAAEAQLALAGIE